MVVTVGSLTMKKMQNFWKVCKNSGPSGAQFTKFLNDVGDTS